MFLNRFHFPLIAMVALFTCALGISLLEAAGITPVSDTPTILLAITACLGPWAVCAERRAAQSKCLQTCRVKQ